MARKVISSILSSVLLLSFLSACGGLKEETKPVPEEPAQATQPEEAQAANPVSSDQPAPFWRGIPS